MKFKIQNLKFNSIDNKNTKEGFTLLEILIVLGIIIILLGISTGVYFSFKNRSYLEVDSEKIISALRLAQNKTVASEDFSTFGVRFDTVNNSFIIFKTPFDSGNIQNAISSLDDRLEFTNVNVTGIEPEVIFSRLSGTTLNSGFIELRDKKDSSRIAVICVEFSGSIYTSQSEICSSDYLEYTEGDIDNDLAFFPNNSGFGDPAQSFTTTQAVSLAYINLYLRKSDIPSDIYLELRSTSTVGPVLGESTLISGSFLPASLSWIRFVFPRPIFLDANTQYFMRLRSLPDSTNAFSGAQETVIWGYEHSATSPPAYSGGDAWRYVGGNANELEEGERLGPSDQYDFSFQIFQKEAPSNTDSRHLKFNLGFDLSDYTNITLSFDGGTQVEIISIADFITSGIFNWEGTALDQTIKIHSLYMDSTDTILSVHRDRELNDLSLVVSIDSIQLVSYTVGGTATKGATIDSMVYR